MSPGTPAREVDEQLIATITEALTGENGQYHEVIGPGAETRVDLVRRCGRIAGRRLKTPVRTFTRAHKSGAHGVWVVSTRLPDPDDEVGQHRLQRRMRAAVEAAAALPPDPATGPAPGSPPSGERGT